jgi:hypothetical protein
MKLSALSGQGKDAQERVLRREVGAGSEQLAAKLNHPIFITAVIVAVWWGIRGVALPFPAFR